MSSNGQARSRINYTTAGAFAAFTIATTDFPNYSTSAITFWPRRRKYHSSRGFREPTYFMSNSSIKALLPALVKITTRTSLRRI